ncbi:TraB/GumN family protein [Erythrobacter sp. JK5]|uniref:TraB/GumN family protein n=1 Tax=Erythrobacter sp. JK5 TaxID=2829500 RepID=UPI001BA5FC1A|nr:TraB/GumN family protein [Erythrobacter sp. JK5]QUL38758.1 TraB/GumN family protein [Erythrobacter sp. JK5]
MKFSKVLTLTSALSLALLAANPVLADDHAAHEAAAAVAKGPALWKVADEDTTIYLFGTIHALPKEIEWYDAEIAEALTASDTIVTEIKLDKQSEAAMQQLAIAKGLLPPDTTLRSLLDDDQTATYEAAMTKLGLPTEAFDRLEPWMAALSLTMLPLMQQGYSPDSGVDKVLIQKAGDKSQDALETAEFQIAIFDEMAQDAQIAFMIEAAEGIDEVKPMLDRMVEVWVKGDADTLAEFMNENMDDPMVAEKLLFERNRNWAEWIDTRLDSPGTIFMAVGAGHLAGEKSVQDYLAERGIETIRVQ